MNNILIQHDWNNHKEMSQKKLVEGFIKLSLSNKIKVYRILSDRRKLILRKGYGQWKKAQNIMNWEENKLDYLRPLKEDIEMSDIKTDIELDLTVAILLTVDQRAYVDYDTSNLSKEEESFELAREKMIGWIGSIAMRNNPTARYQSDIENTFEINLIAELEKLKYIVPTTLTKHKKAEMTKWKEWYQHIGVGKERANRLVAGLGKQIMGYHYHGKISDKQMEYNDWKDTMSEDKEYFSQALEEILEHF